MAEESEKPGTVRELASHVVKVTMVTMAIAVPKTPEDMAHAVKMAEMLAEAQIRRFVDDLLRSSADATSEVLKSEQ